MSRQGGLQHEGGVPAGPLSGGRQQVRGMMGAWNALERVRLG